LRAKSGAFAPTVGALIAFNDSNGINSVKKSLIVNFIVDFDRDIK